MLVFVIFAMSVFISFSSENAHAISLHNSAGTQANGSTKAYWNMSGGWGVTGGKYGQFTCSTCHQPDAPNIKTIKSRITAPNGGARRLEVHRLQEPDHGLPERDQYGLHGRGGTYRLIPRL